MESETLDLVEKLGKRLTDATLNSNTQVSGKRYSFYLERYISR